MLTLSRLELSSRQLATIDNGNIADKLTHHRLHESNPFALMTNLRTNFPHLLTRQYFLHPLLFDG